mgnify:FL=1
MIDVVRLTSPAPSFAPRFSLDDGTHVIGRLNFHRTGGDPYLVQHLNRNWLQVEVQGNQVSIQKQGGNGTCCVIRKRGRDDQLCSSAHAVVTTVPFELLVPTHESVRTHGSQRTCREFPSELVSYLVSRHKFQCSECGRACVSESRLRSHVERDHSRVPVDADGWATRKRKR